MILNADDLMPEDPFVADEARSLILNWLRRLYGKATEGWATINYLPIGSDLDHPLTIGEPVDRLHELAAEGATYVDTCDIWFGVATRREPLGEYRRGGNADCLQLPGLPLDLDILDPEHHAETNLPTSIEAARLLVAKFPLPPSAIVDSGHGLQPWWLFEEMAAIDLELLDRWQVTWNRHAARFGWRVDNVRDPARMMRLPGTSNRKGDPRPVHIIESTWTRYTPADLLARLDEAPSPPKRELPPRKPGDAKRPGDSFNEDPGAGERMVLDVGCTLKQELAGRRDYYRPGKVKGSQSVSLYDDGHITVWSSTLANQYPALRKRMDESKNGGAAAFDPFGFYAAIYHGGDINAATKDLGSQDYGDPLPDLSETWPVRTTPNISQNGNGAIPAIPSSAPHLPEEFWSKRPELAHIKQAANRYLVGPDAALWAVLAYTTMLTDWRFVLPGQVGGGHGSLNQQLVIADVAGGGKGTPAKLAAQLCANITTAASHVTKKAGAGSGEGLVAVFFDLVAGEGGKQKPEQVYRGVLVEVTEGEALDKLCQRSGQTTGETIRQTFDGDAIGGSYAGRTKAYRLEAGTYRLAMLVCVQPELAGFLLGATAETSGAARRLLWTAGGDPDAPDEAPEDPGPLDLKIPTWGDVMPGWKPGDYDRKVMKVAEPIQAKIRADRLAGLRSGEGAASADNYLRLKVAAQFALWQGRTTIEVKDWDLAGELVDHSARVVSWAKGKIAAAEAQRDHAAAIKAGDRTFTAESRAECHRVIECARRIATKVKAKPDRSRHDLRVELRRWRDVFDDGLDHAKAQQWVEEKTEPGQGTDKHTYHPGEKCSR